MSGQFPYRNEKWKKQSQHLPLPHLYITDEFPGSVQAIVYKMIPENILYVCL